VVVEEWSNHRKVDSGPDDTESLDRSPVLIALLGDAALDEEDIEYRINWHTLPWSYSPFHHIAI
jgi:hypothetical protein